MGKKRMIGDPYLRDRVIFSEEASSLKKWVVVFSILGIVSIVAIASVYFPQMTTTIKTYLKLDTSSDKSADKTKDQDLSLPPSNETPATDVETAVKKPEISEPLQSTETTIASTIDIPPQIEAESSKIPETKTSEKTTVDSESQALIEDLAENVSEQSAKTSIETTASDSTPTQMTAEVEKLLAKAKKQIKQRRFTTPEANNAYETYQTLAKISPEHAKPILDEILAWYSERGEKLLERNSLLQPANKSAYKTYETMQAIAPEHTDSKAFLEKLLSALEEQASQQIDKGRLIKPQENNAQKTYLAMQAIAPEREKTQKISEAILDPLFEKAEAQIQKRKLTTPKNDSALGTYREILAMFPENARAKTGLKKIAEEYYALALKKEKQGLYSSSLVMIERGLEIVPDDSKLLTLKEKINLHLK